ncbi:MAG: hypothetical protein LBO20_10085, partial [Bifidobacteriaceae bacterium]|nr:hypothetical protein [Bifidobacteriaceae bacterium]
MASTSALFVSNEIETQPECWETAAACAPAAAEALPRPGEEVAVIGCGTSWFVAMAYAALREDAGQGRTDAFTASEFPPSRRYDRVIAITRSGTTTEVVQALEALPAPHQTTAIVGVLDTPAARAGGATIDLSFADERSVVQTRFATSALALLRAHLGQDLTAAVEDARDAIAEPLDPAWLEADHIAFLGRGWTIGLAQEAALKAREASLSFTEAHPAMDYRHGPIALAQPGRLVWMFGEAPPNLADQVRLTGATWIDSPIDPMA